MFEDPEKLSPEEVMRLIENDPMISQGYMKADLYVMFFETGDSATLNCLWVVKIRSRAGFFDP